MILPTQEATPIVELDSKILATLSQGAIELLVDGFNAGGNKLTIGSLLVAYFNKPERSVNQMITKMGGSLTSLKITATKLLNSSSSNSNISDEIIIGLKAVIKEQERFNKAATDPNKRELYVSDDNLFLWMRTSPTVNKIIDSVISTELSLKEFQEQLDAYTWVPNLNRDTTSTSTMDAFGINLTDKNNLDDVLARDKEKNDILTILLSKNKNGALLVGKAGTGKTAIVEALAAQLNHPTLIPEDLIGYKIYSVDPKTIKASMIPSLVSTAIANNCIVFIDELHVAFEDDAIRDAFKPILSDQNSPFKMIGATTDAEALKFNEDAAIVRRFSWVRVNQVTKEQTFSILEYKAKGLEKHHRVKFTELSVVDTVRLSIRYLSGMPQPDAAITVLDKTAARVTNDNTSKSNKLIALQARRNSLLAHNRMILLGSKQTITSKNTLEKNKEEIEDLEILIQEHQSKFENRLKLLEELNEIKNEQISMETNHEICLQLADWLGAQEIITTAIPDLKKKEQEIIIKLRGVGYRDEITSSDVRETIEILSGITINEDDLKTVKELPQKLNKVIKGQPEAIELCTKHYKLAAAGFKKADKPTASFIFAGTTGVGKTKLAQEIANFYYGSHNQMLRLDMTEYSEAHASARLFGSPPGYIGSQAGGQLTEWVKQHPYGLVLFDEIEKAHPTIRQKLLAILDSGRATDGKGHTVDMNNCTIVFTTNLGAEILSMDIDPSLKKAGMDKVFKQEFSPEFMGRISEVIVFNTLTLSALREIVQHQMNDFIEQLAQEKGISLIITDESIDLLTLKSLDKNFKTVTHGGRAVEAQISIIQEKLTDLIIEVGNVVSNGTIFCAVDNDQISVDLLSHEEAQEAQKEFDESSYKRGQLEDIINSKDKEIADAIIEKRTPIDAIM